MGTPVLTYVLLYIVGMFLIVLMLLRTSHFGGVTPEQAGDVQFLCPTACGNAPPYLYIDTFYVVPLYIVGMLLGHCVMVELSHIYGNTSTFLKISIFKGYL